MTHPKAALAPIVLTLLTAAATAGPPSLAAFHRRARSAGVTAGQHGIRLGGYVLDSFGGAPDNFDPEGIPDRVEVLETGQRAPIRRGRFDLIGVPGGRPLTLVATAYNPMTPNPRGGLGMFETTRLTVTPKTTPGGVFHVPLLRTHAAAPPPADPPPPPAGTKVDVRGRVFDSWGNHPNQLHPQGIPDHVVVLETGQLAHIVDGEYFLPALAAGRTVTLKAVGFNPLPMGPSGAPGVAEFGEVAISPRQTAMPHFEAPVISLR